MKMFAIKSNILDCQQAFDCVIYDRIAHCNLKIFSNLVFKTNTNFLYDTFLLLDLIHRTSILHVFGGRHQHSFYSNISVI